MGETGSLLHTVMDIPRRVLYFYLRVTGFALLVLYALGQRLWGSVAPSIGPLQHIHSSIDTKSLSLVTIVEQGVRMVMMVGLLYFRMMAALFETLTKPFPVQVAYIKEAFNEFNSKYHLAADTKHTE